MNAHGDHLEVILDPLESNIHNCVARSKKKAKPLLAAQLQLERKKMPV